jgi:hypothetical protein
MTNRTFQTEQLATKVTIIGDNALGYSIALILIWIGAMKISA